VHVSVLDIGGRLEADKADARERLALAAQPHWHPQDVAAVTQLPVTSTTKGVPEKRTYGSDYPFRDFGQREGLIACDGINDALVSGAYGGFSNAWGAQFMPFTAATFRRWPISVEEMHRHYRPILQNIPYAAEEDDLAELFPLLDGATPLPRLSPRSHAVLVRYARHRERLNRRGVLLGRARLAMDAPGCVRCGLCMTGCPYSLVYSASHTMDGLRQRSRITYYEGLLAVRVEEEADSVTVVAKELETGRHQRFSADLVLLACGAVGTSRLVMGSLGLFDTPAEIIESRQFALPFLSGRAVADPRRTNDFTLNQFNMVVKLDAEAYDLSLLHFYTYNPAFLDALPTVVRRRRAGFARAQLLRRLSVALGYLPSWASPNFVLRAHRPAVPGTLPSITVTSSRDRSTFANNAMLRGVLSRVWASAPFLDLWPLLPALRVSAEGKSYHWGGTFPHSDRPVGRFSSDKLGRVAPWRRVHLVDSSVFPTVPANTFALTAMANAHRIADTALKELA
jgi:choline dehydrogenase-like flavoprotein